MQPKAKRDGSRGQETIGIPEKSPSKGGLNPGRTLPGHESVKYPDETEPA